LSVGTWPLGRSRVCSTDMHECRSTVERGREASRYGHASTACGDRTAVPPRGFLGRGHVYAPT
jgi:hypothetical protein